MSTGSATRGARRGRTTDAPSRPARHLPSLTSLRIFGAAGVLAVHLADNIRLFPGAPEVFRPGYLGVTFFFVLSGFVLTWNHRDSDRVRSFWARRVARIYPLHLLTTALAVVLALAAGRAVDWSRLPAVLLLVQALVPDHEQYYAFNPVSWTLSCDVVFYVLFPVLLAAALRLRRPIAWVPVVLAGMGAATLAVYLLAPTLGSLAGVPPEAIVGYTLSISPWYRLGEFVAGVLMGLAFRRGMRSPVGVGTAGVVTLAAMTTFAAVDAAWPVPADVPGLLMIPVFGFLVVAAATTDLAGRSCVLQRPSLVLLGQSSFALYLVHLLILTEVAPLVPTVMPAAVAAALVVVSSLASGLLLHRYVEGPSERWVRVTLTGRGDSRVSDRSPSSDAVGERTPGWSP